MPKNARNLPASSGDLSTLAAGTDFVVSADFAEVDEGAGDGLVVLAPEEDMMLSVCSKQNQDLVQYTNLAAR